MKKAGGEHERRKRKKREKNVIWNSSYDIGTTNLHFLFYNGIRCIGTLFSIGGFALAIIGLDSKEKDDKEE